VKATCTKNWCSLDAPFPTYTLEQTYSQLCSSTGRELFINSRHQNQLLQGMYCVSRQTTEELKDVRAEFYCRPSIKYLTVPNNSHLHHCACAISQSLVRRCLLGPFHAAIAVSSVTRYRRCRGHRCAGGARQYR